MKSLTGIAGAFMVTLAVPSLALFLIAQPSLALAQDRADEVIFLDRTKKENQRTTRRGTVVSENPAKVALLFGVNKTRQEIATADIVDIRYDGEPPEMTQARTAENRKDHERALNLYKDAKKSAPTGNKLLMASLLFRIAKLQAIIAESGSGGARVTAIDDLRAFRRDHADSRHIVECLELLSRLLTMEGKSNQEVVSAFATLRTSYASNKEIAAKCDLFEGQLLLQEGQLLLREHKADQAKQKYQQAQTKLQAMLQGADKTAGLEMRVSLAECKAALGDPAGALKDLDAVFAEAGDDARLRAVAHLGRGDCYRMNNQFREAMWDYLWVDVIYNQDREQNAKALYFLQEVFERLNEPAKAKETRERLKTDARLKDTRYQRITSVQ
jgi:tetratricopeptide (TPR) repeat protein